MTTSLSAALDAISPAQRRLIDAALEHGSLPLDGALSLCRARGPELHALTAAADVLRREQVGDVVSYVVNRNINFTNVCVKACKFCAFARTHRSEQGYSLGIDEVVRRAREAHELGATEVCIQAGLAPDLEPWFYRDVCAAVKEALPDIQVHAFSPEEIKYGAGLAGVSFAEYLSELKAAGLTSLPGTSAEILDDDVRRRLAGARITRAEWIDIVTTAHRLGLPTTSTIMFGHLDTPEDQVRHLDVLRSVQAQTHGFTELVPLSFVHTEAPLYLKRMVPGVRPGPTGNEVIRLFALARLMLGASIPNLQASWVKEGLRSAQWLLSCGANDLGGTLINESISTSAGAQHGQLATPGELRRLVRDAGRVPAQRDTAYRLLRVFGAEPAEGEDDPLDRVGDAEDRFGSYERLTRDDRFKYRRAPKLEVVG